MFTQLYCRQTSPNTLSVVGRLSTQKPLELRTEMAYSSSLELRDEHYHFEINHEESHPLALNGESSLHLGIEALLTQAHWPQLTQSVFGQPMTPQRFAIGSLFLRAVRPSAAQWRYVVVGEWTLPPRFLPAGKTFAWLYGMMEGEHGTLALRELEADPVKSLSMCKALSSPNVWSKLVKKSSRC